MIQFKELRLNGFKSFVERTELEIGTGLNGIVGPNGCGKSNLVEALRWVMGENSAKRMRGGAEGMEAVIFAGTERRPARNFAEVALLLDNSKRTAPAAYNESDEIEVIRKIERDHGSSYKINGKNVRARDVQMLFADTVTGASSPALVSQGQVTRIINSKPLDRRMILEESAGISGLYVRRHEAELRLRAADANMLRIQDIVASMEERLNALKRQARQANRYRNVNAQIRQLELLIAYLDWRHLEERQDAVRKNFEQIESTVAEKLGTVTQLTKTQTTQSEDLPGLRKAEAEISATLQTQKIALQRIEDENNRLDTAMLETKARLEQCQADSEHENQVLAESSQTLARMQEEEAKIIGEQSKEDGKLEEKNRVREELEIKVNALEEQYTALMQSAAETRARRASLVQQISQNEERLQVIATRKAKAEEMLAAMPKDQEKSDQSQEALNQINVIEKELQKLDEDVTAAYEEFQKSQKRVDEERGALNAIESKRSEFNAEIAMLETFFNEEKDNSYSPVLEQVAADKGFEKALSRALGDSLMASLEENAPSVWIKRTIASLPALPNGAVSLLPHIKAPEALHLALSQIGYVATEEEGQKLVNQLAPGQSLVSAQGTYWRWDGYCVKATATDRHGLHLEQKNKLKELQRKRPQIEGLVEQAQKTFERAVAEQEKAKARYEELQAKLKNDQATLNQKRAAHARMREDLAKGESELARLTDAITVAQEDIATLEKANREAKSQLATYEESAQSKQDEDIEELRYTLQTAREAHQSAVRSFDLYQQEQNSRRARLHAMADERVNLQNRSIRARERIKELTERQAEMEQKFEELRRQPKNFKDDSQKLLARISELEQQRQEAADKLATCETEVTETGRALKEAEASLGQAREERAGAQATLAALGEQLATMQQSIVEQFEMPATELAQHLNIEAGEEDTGRLEQLKAQKEKLTRERENIGAVNLQADDEAQKLEGELATLLAERNDLQQAIDELRGGIQKINKEASERLMVAFEQVNTHFQALFSKLFAGGKAHLALIDSDNVLEAGLEIFAQPPGKSLQSLSLLSGGEQTLASISLIFAMFLTNPSPICVLDEIDAPLDDANVDRMCDMLDEIAARGETRFLVVTHHRLTMARMDRLYGVTMAERGVSQLVSVDLQQSFAFMEAA